MYHISILRESERWEAAKNLVGGGGVRVGGVAVKISSKLRGICTAIHYTVMVEEVIAGSFSPGECANY